MCNSRMSVIRALNMQKQAASWTRPPLWLTTQKMGARISFMPCTYSTRGFSRANTNRMRVIQSQRQVACISCIDNRRGLSFRGLSYPLISRCFSRRVVVKKGTGKGSVGPEKKDSSDCVRQVSFSICSHSRWSCSKAANNCGEEWRSSTIGHSLYLPGCRNCLTNSAQSSSCFLACTCHFLRSRGKNPSATFQAYSLTSDASSGTPVAISLLSWRRSTSGELSRSMSGCTFGNKLAGSSSAVKMGGSQLLSCLQAILQLVYKKQYSLCIGLLSHCAAFLTLFLNSLNRIPLNIRSNACYFLKEYVVNRAQQNQRGLIPWESRSAAILAMSLLRSLSTLVKLDTGFPALQMMKQGHLSSGNLSMHLVATILTNLTCAQSLAMTGRCWLIRLQNSLQFWQRCRMTKDSGSASVTSRMYSTLEISITCPYFSFVDFT